MVCRKSSVFALVALAMVAFSMALFSSSASAREAVSPPSPEDFAAALGAAKTPAAISFAKTNFRQVHGVEPSTVTVADHGVAAYVLNPDFVRGVAGAPAGVLQYIAVTAVADNGVRATLRANPEDGGDWVVGSVFSGDDEEVLSQRLRPGSVLLNEPQINGWYELTPTGVALLQASLPQSEVGEFIPIAEYRKQVRARYGDKLPGSDYEKNRGLGFTRQDDAAAPPTDRGPSAAELGLPIAGAVVLLAFAVVVFRRYRYSHRKSTPASEGSRASK